MSSFSSVLRAVRSLQVRVLTVVLAAVVLVLCGPAGSASASVPGLAGTVNSVQSFAFTNDVIVTGWLVDPADVNRPGAIEVTADKQVLAGWQATKVSRPDVDQAYRSAGAHGYAITVSAPAGVHTICVNARAAAGRTPSRSLGCFSFRGYPQATAADMKTMAKSIDPKGTINWEWTVKPSTIFAGQAQPWNNVILISSGNSTRYLRAVMLHEWSHVLQYRAFGGGNGWWDAMQSFNALLGDPGDQVSVNGLEHGADCIAKALGADYLGYGCPAALAAFGARIAHGAMMNTPQGALQSATAVGSKITVTGWSIDPANPTSSNQVQVTDNGRAVTGWAPTSVNRADVNTQAGVTGRHGFVVALTLPAGVHRICVSSVSLTTGNSPTTLAGCTTVTSS